MRTVTLPSKAPLLSGKGWTAFFIALIVACLAGSAFFAGLETGVVAVNRLRLRHLVQHRVPGARFVEDFLREPDRLLGTTLIGTNLCHVVMTVAAFLFSLVAAYMAGLVGSSSNPVSGVTIATIMAASLYGLSDADLKAMAHYLSQLAP